MALAIEARGLAKQYRIGQYAASYDTLRDELVRLSKRVLGRTSVRESMQEIWALKGVDFDVEEGEVVGIIGPNGAGKTTLLRILSRITEPSAGYADVYGRVGSLLEVGTGFHPELTGRENVFFNGALLGMRRAEIARKFDEIVDFSGVEQFIDTPVKRYSSGMQVRLAFSVAAHLEPDILIADEVLAVGDAEFQRKCIGKMESVGNEGRTVLFVSHQMPAVARLCPRAILLDSGKVSMDGPTGEVIERYLREHAGRATLREFAEREAPGDDYARILSIRVSGADGETVSGTSQAEPVGVEVTFDVLRDDLPLVPMIELYNQNGMLMFNALDPNRSWQSPQCGRHVSCAWIPASLLDTGEYTAHVSVNTLRPGRFDRHAFVPDAVTFIVSGPGARTTESGHAETWGGVVAPSLTWTYDGEGHSAADARPLGRVDGAHGR